MQQRTIQIARDFSNINGGAMRRTKLREPEPDAVLLERLENRSHFSVTTSSGSVISDLADWTYYGQAEIGGGQWSGEPGSSAGERDTELAWADTNWAVDANGAIDTGNVKANLDVSAGAAGGLSWSIDGSSPAGFTTSSSGGFSRVAIQAAVQGSGMAMTWSNVTVSFYSNGQVGEVDHISLLQANTFDATDGSPAEALAVVQADHGGYDRVVVTGTVRLQSQDWVYPNPGDIFGKVAVS